MIDAGFLPIRDRPKYVVIKISRKELLEVESLRELEYLLTHISGLAWVEGMWVVEKDMHYEPTYLIAPKTPSITTLA